LFPYRLGRSFTILPVRDIVNLEFAEALTMHLLPLFALASFALTSVNAIAPITAKGSKFFSSGQQFFIKGSY
jgi:hypothetical protein